MESHHGRYGSPNYSRNTGGAGQKYQCNEDSTTHKIKKAYWTTKQAVIQKLGRKEDEYVVASDSPLDSKLELFKSVQKTCFDLTRVIERYQQKIFVLSQAENEMGRFLKERSKLDKTQAGRMMAAVGKSLSYSAQQRIALRVPLSRLQSDVETFRRRAISDTLLTLHRMESARTDYRGALLWMKNVSEELDPDTDKQLEKFRKVQTQVRKTKAQFDRYKLDSMQKIDLLAASRSNMCSHALGIYQKTLLHFWGRTCRTMVAVADSFKGYQYYEFSMLKDLTDAGRKLADNYQSEQGSQSGITTDDPDINQSLQKEGEKNEDIDLLGENFDDNTPHAPVDSGFHHGMDEEEFSKKLDEIFDDFKDDNLDNLGQFISSHKQEDVDNGSQLLNLQQSSEDLFSDTTDQNNEEERAFLMDLLSGEETTIDTLSANLNTADQIGEPAIPDWHSLFKNIESEEKGLNHEGTDSVHGNLQSVFEMQSTDLAEASNWLSDLKPSSLLDFSNLSSSMLNKDQIRPSTTSMSLFTPSTEQNVKSALSGADNKETPAWLSLFADLDPLANPDNLSKKEGQISDA